MSFRLALILTAGALLFPACGPPGTGATRLFAENVTPTAATEAVWITPTGRRYHLPDCRVLGDSKEAVSPAEAVARGLEPCKVCRPPVPAGAEPYRLDAAGLPSAASADRARMTAARVVRVVDGDTVRVVVGNPRPALVKGEETVRLLGIDAPESAASPRPEEYYGAESADYVRSILEGKEVFLAFDRDLRDKYGRLLAYLYTPEGECLNLRLVKEGFSAAYLSYPFAFMEEFHAAELRARKAGRGLWSAEPAAER